MAKDPLVKLLEKGARKGLFNTFDATKEFREFLTNDKIDKVKPVNWRDTPEMFLGDLKRLNYISYFRGLHVSDDVVEVPDNWINLVNVSMSIRPEGLLFLNEIRKIRQQNLTNWLTAIFIVATAIIGSANYYVSNKTLNVTESHDAHEVSVSKLKSLLHQQSIHILRLQQDSIQLHQAPRITHKTNQK